MSVPSVAVSPLSEALDKVAEAILVLADGLGRGEVSRERVIHVSQLAREVQALAVEL